ncbi:MAG: hypothetical protein ACKV2U_21260 [Bryobacteraceae bacterium]
MRILLDHNTPAPLRYWLIGNSVETAFERGWAELTNGDLLAVAEEAGFDVVITTDQGIRYQQNLAGRSFALVVIDTNDWTKIRKWRPLVLEALTKIVPGAFIEVEIPYP